ncbi:cytochrome P450 [Stemphylium lycopersici]|uniref:Cytochrome P450 n=1 Tax=Stemphylium lycopersici TaxID=183478 RepID=A0A364N6G3_STELY|nr:cytochrome P450 [Stemphylium lycopersici]
MAILILLASIFGALTLYIFGVIIYRLTLHPLASYPGPLLAKVTDIYLAYYAYKGSRHLAFSRAHEQYGAYVRLGPNLLSVNTATGLKTIYGFRSNVKKASFYEAFPSTPKAISVHSAIDKMQHARKRRVMSHAFSDSAIKSLEKYILANVRVGCELLGRKSNNWSNNSDEKDAGWNDAWNAAHWCEWLVFDIMGDLVFGKAFGMLESPVNRFATQLVGNAAHRHLICGTHLTIHNWHLDKLFFRKIAGQRAQYMQYSKGQAMERTKLGVDVDRKDFFYYLLNAKDPETGKGFNMDELWGESNLLIIAGSDTTSTAMAGTLFYLANNPAAMQKVCKEIRESFTDVEEIVTGPKLSGCSFLRACVDETMRMTPPVAGALPRQILTGGLDIDGRHIPAGVDVGVPIYAIHHNPEYFPRPFDYLPERWLSDPAVNPLHSSLPAAQSAFNPFSIGPRGCIGKGLALAPGTTLGAGSSELEEGRNRPTEYQTMDVFARQPLHLARWQSSRIHHNARVASVSVREEIVQTPSRGPEISLTDDRAASKGYSGANGVALMRIPRRLSRRDIEELLQSKGLNFKRLQMRVDRFSFQNDSYCFLELGSQKEVDDATKLLDKIVLHGKPIIAQPLKSDFQWGLIAKSQSPYGSRYFLDEGNAADDALLPLVEGRRMFLSVQTPGWAPKSTVSGAKDYSIEVIQQNFDKYGIERLSDLSLFHGDKKANPRMLCMVDFTTKDGAERAAAEHHDTVIQDRLVWLRPCEPAPWRVHQFSKFAPKLVADLQEKGTFTKEAYEDKFVNPRPKQNKK